jgi:uncharacterized coiled-coil DUF342 family protein
MKELNDYTIEEIKELARLGQKFESMRDTYNTTSEKLIEISKSLRDIATEINPLAKTRFVSPNGKYVRGERTEIIENIYEKMTHGTQVTIDLIDTMYPDRDDDWKKNLMQKIKQMPNVEKTYDGRKLRLFVK